MSEKACEIGAKLNDNFQPERWATVFDVLPESVHHKARELIITLTLCIAASWEERVHGPSCDFPLLLLRMLESPQGQFCEVRQQVAQSLLDLLEQGAEKLIRRHSDVTVKLCSLYKTKFEHAAATGTCEPDLYIALLTLRRVCPLNTQDIEGNNSELQELIRRSPFIKWARASDKIQLKSGDEITVQELVDLHEETQAYMKTLDYLHRFLPGGSGSLGAREQRSVDNL